ncbi:MAG: hypothetical protein ACK4IU_18530 [Tabrizicola flagellatus]
MTPFLMFFFGFLAGAFVGFRDWPLAALALGGCLLLATLRATGSLS